MAKNNAPKTKITFGSRKTGKQKKHRNKSDDFKPYKGQGK